MPHLAHLSQDQRVALNHLLQSRLVELEHDRKSQLQGQSQVVSARQTLLEDADDASQRSGEHEVEGIVSDIDSGEFQAVRDALQRIHRVDFGMCVDCHDAIPYARLQIEPQALRCAACQTLHERNTQP